MLRILEYIVLAIGVVAIIVFSYWIGQQAYAWMPVEATTDANRIDALFSFLVWMSAIIFFGVVGMLAYSLLTCRAAKDDYTEGHPARGNWKIEAFWTGLPIVLVVWISTYSFIIYQKMDIEGPSQILGDLQVPVGVESVYAQTSDRDRKNDQTPSIKTIEVISKQWAWTFRYREANVTSSELHLPVNQRVRLLLRSEDVLHGFYVPQFRIKQDIIPNRPIDFQFIPIRVGKYQLQDSQFSGTYFALMQADVYVDTPEDYSRWLEMAANGERAIASNHAVDEYARPPKRLWRSNWQTIEPARPPLVNYAS